MSRNKVGRRGFTKGTTAAALRRTTQRIQVPDDDSASIGFDATGQRTVQVDGASPISLGRRGLSIPLGGGLETEDGKLNLKLERDLEVQEGKLSIPLDGLGPLGNDAQGRLTIKKGDNVAEVTDSTGGTVQTSLSDVTASYSQTILNDNFATVNDQIDKIIAALEKAKLLKDV